MITRLLFAGLFMALIDLIWLRFIARGLYRSEMGSILLDKPNATAAVLFYIIYVLGIVVFAVNPAIDKQSLQHAAMLGAFFGFVAYATFDLTSLAVIKGFTNKIVIIDLIWGTVLTSSVATATYFVVTRFFS